MEEYKPKSYNIYLTQLHKYHFTFVGNKSDLGERRQVEESMAAQFAAERGLAYIETSAMESANIREAFLTLVRPRLRLNRASSTASSNVSNS